MFNHCGREIKPTETWYLAETKECNNRILHIAFCPRCLKSLTCLSEQSKSENKTFNKIKFGSQALKEIELCKTDKLYTAFDLKVKKGKPYSWIYGENVEICNNKGKVIKIRQKACDYFGQKEVIKEICVN